MFPVDNQKRPRTRNGFKGASLNADQFKAGDGIGIATGQVSALVVIDLDEKNGKHGVAEFQKLIDLHPELPWDTRAVKTPSGGAHFYYNYTGPLKSRIDHPAPGIDLKADGGYVCAPPTVLKNGDFYSVLGEVEPIDLPEWLVEIFTAPGRDKQPEPGATRQETAYKAPYKAPETIPAGSRNDTLYRTACSLAAKGMGDSAVLAAVLAENKTKCSSPLDDAEIQTLVHSACVFNRQHPPTSQPMPLRDPPIRKAQVPSTEDHPYDFNLIATRLRDKFNVISFKKTLFRYKDGIYVEDEGYLDSCIVTELLQSGIPEDGRVTTASQQVRHYLTYGKVEPEYPFNLATDAVPVRNGILKIDFTTGATTLLPFSPEYRFNYKLAVAYNATANGEPIKKYLESLGTDTDLLLQIPAHAILGMLGRVYKKAYFLQGGPNSGKSTFVDLNVRYLFGIPVCSSVSLQALLFDRFRLAELDGKIMNAYADLSDQKLREIGMFKALTGGDLYTVERKHRDPYQMRNKSLLLFSANKYPKITTGDDAFWGRWIAMEFRKTFPVDTTFTERTFTDANISGYLTLVLAKMQEIIRTVIKVTDNVEQVWLSDASSSHRFIQEELERCDGAVLVKAEAYKKYVEFCHAGDYEIEAQRIFSDALKSSGALSVRPTINNQQQHCYQGLKSKNAEPVFPDRDSYQKTVTDTGV